MSSAALQQFETPPTDHHCPARNNAYTSHVRLHTDPRRFHHSCADLHRSPHAVDASGLLSLHRPRQWSATPALRWSDIVHETIAQPVAGGGGAALSCVSLAYLCRPYYRISLRPVLVCMLLCRVPLPVFVRCRCPWCCVITLCSDVTCALPCHMWCCVWVCCRAQCRAVLRCRRWWCKSPFTAFRAVKPKCFSGSHHSRHEMANLLWFLSRSS